MALNLSKNETLNLTKEVPSLKRVKIGLGWDTNSSGRNYDLDASVIMLGDNGKLLTGKKKFGLFGGSSTEYAVVCYYHKTSDCGGIHHNGDNLTGEGEGDDEVINVDLERLDERITELLFVVNIYEANSRGQKFGEVKNAYIRLIDDIANTEIAKYSLSDNYNKETGMIFGKLTKVGNEWSFTAVGMGEEASLKDYIAKYK